MEEEIQVKRQQVHNSSYGVAGIPCGPLCLQLELEAAAGVTEGGRKLRANYVKELCKGTLRRWNIVKRIQLPIGDCQLPTTQWSSGYPSHNILLHVCSRRFPFHTRRQAKKDRTGRYEG